MLDRVNILASDPKKRTFVFWTGMFVLFFIICFQFKASPLVNILGAFVIFLLSVLPFYFWCVGTAKGLPIFPLAALSYLWSYAFPLINGHPAIAEYSGDQILGACAVVSCHIAVAFLVWLRWARLEPTNFKAYRGLDVRGGFNFFTTVIFLGVLFNISYVMLISNMAVGVFPIVRAFIGGLCSLGIFIIGYRFGGRTLSYGQKLMSFLLIGSYLVSLTLGIYLVEVLIALLLFTAGYFLASGKIPFLLFFGGVLLAGFLHLGKAEMREESWASDSQRTARSIFSFYQKWTDYSWRQFTGKSDDSNEQESFLYRSSTIQMLLKVMSISPRTEPYLGGATYEIIPQVLGPRIFNKNKIRTQEGNHILSVYYGLKTYEQTFITSVGWGLLPEAYANYGFWGGIGLAILLGALYGVVTRWSMGYPLLSFRVLFSLILLRLSFQTEYTMGTFVSVLFQNTVVLLIVAGLFMKRYLYQMPGPRSET